MIERRVCQQKKLCWCYKAVVTKHSSFTARENKQLGHHTDISIVNCTGSLWSILEVYHDGATQGLLEETQ